MNSPRILALTAVLMTGSVFAADADSWYPLECCPDYDCAPVETLKLAAPTGGGTPQLIVASKHGKAIVPQSLPVRESKDGRMHVCMRYDPFGAMEAICLFAAPDP